MSVVSLRPLVVLVLAGASLMPLFRPLPAWSDPGTKPVPLGLNLSGVTDYAPDIVFVDAFKTARAWVAQAPGKPWGQGGPLDLDAKGNVKSLAPGQSAEAVVYTGFGHHFPAGAFTCLYDGDGDLDFSFDARVMRRQPGRLTVAVAPRTGQVFARLTRTNPKDPVRNIRLILPGFEKTYADQPFHPDFLKRWRGFRVFRFMDWGRTNDSKVAAWTDRPTPDMHSQAVRGVAVEYMVRLCNQLDTAPWFCMPHLASDGYVRRFAEFVKEHLKPSLKVYVEYSNECWNGQFGQARYCREQGRKLGLSANDYEAQLRFYTRRSVEVFRIWAEVFGGRDRLVRVLAVQAANPWTATAVVDWDGAAKQADALAIAPYFGFRWGDPRTADKVAAMSPDELVRALPEDLAASRKHMAAHAAEARKRGLALIAYEGGQHLVGYGGAENNERLTRLFEAVNRRPEMKDLYLKDLQNWQEEGGGLFCVFASMGRPSKWGNWGLLEDTGEDPRQAPKYQAIREYLRRGGQQP